MLIVYACCSPIYNVQRGERRQERRRKKAHREEGEKLDKKNYRDRECVVKNVALQ